MFTGIIEEIGTLIKVKQGEKSFILTIQAITVLEGTKVGDSIATNGVCLTVTKLGTDYFQADVMAESLRRSNLGQQKIGSLLNLERALRLDSRLGGHLVSGHVDGVGTITQLLKEDNAVWITIKTTKEILHYIVEKGSIAIDGVSLTVASVGDSSFQVSVIPHTAKKTILLQKKIGEQLNLECDMIGKYIEKFLPTKKKESAKQKIDAMFLMEHGFL